MLGDEFGDVEGGNWAAGGGEAAGDLHEAAGVVADDGGGFGGLDGAELLAEDGGGDGGVVHREGSAKSAADV